jgi:hypothetical protein
MPEANTIQKRKPGRVLMPSLCNTPGVMGDPGTGTDASYDMGVLVDAQDMGAGGMQVTYYPPENADGHGGGEGYDPFNPWVSVPLPPTTAPIAGVLTPIAADYGVLPASRYLLRPSDFARPLPSIIPPPLAASTETPCNPVEGWIRENSLLAVASIAAAYFLLRRKT